MAALEATDATSSATFSDSATRPVCTTALSRRRVGWGSGTVTTYLQRATAAGLTWPLPDDLDDAALEARLFRRAAVAAARDRPVPEWTAAPPGAEEAGRHADAAVAGISRAHPTGYAYSQFCERYRRWARALKPSMRQVHRAGEKLFVDFSGKRPHLVDPDDR